MSQPGLDFSGTSRFQVLSRLGEGGMGVVYRALDRERNTRIALKTLSSLSGDALLRFKNEFRALADLSHPNLVSLGELIYENGRWFFTMELVEGIDLLSWVRPGGGKAARGDTPSAPLARTQPSLVGALPSGVRPPPGPLGRLDEGRLRSAFGQLARGLATLHAASKVHRDIKPSNVLVTAEGRVVLLDFGLATDVVRARALSDVHAVGTVNYMAPEQAASRPVGPEADWYSVGIVLYEALTGRVPFSGAPLEVLMNKQRFEPAPPRALVPDVPKDLDALCVDLLRFDADARPRAREVLERLGALVQAAELPPERGRTLTRAIPFVGRTSELEALAQAYADTRAGRAVSLFVEGESGVGKSLLVRRFVESLPLSEPDAVILLGRCYEREAVPYKAFDGIIDALSRYMMKLGKAEAAALLPLKAALLAQVFPVLRRVEAVAQAPLPQHEVIDPQELRTRVFAALRELFGRLADRRPLVLVIDDLQWADADSLALLAEILRPPDAPALLLLATVRTNSDDAAASDALIARLTGEIRHVEVTSLPTAEACALVELLWREAAKTAPLDAAAIVEETHGHPLFIDELVRHLMVQGEELDARDDHKPPSLQEALGSRVQKLDPAVRHLLELVCVAGAPLRQETLARAAGLEADLSRHLAILRVANLVRTSGARGGDSVEAYHDRVRDAVLARLDDVGRSSLHERLALALEATRDSDPEALSMHWLGAGDPEKAGRYAATAAEKASEALAFDRAVRLYRVALGLAVAPGAPAPQPEAVRALKARLAEALANAGRGPDAARLYLEAAEGTNAAEQLEMRRRAAEQFLRSGHMDDGMNVLKQVLAAVGMKVRSTSTGALLSLLARRARVRLRGLGFVERDESQVAARELTEIDILWSASVGLGMVDNVRGADYQTQHLITALKSGEPYRICRAMAMEAAYASTAGPGKPKRAQRLLTAMDLLSEKIQVPHATGMAQTAHSIVTFMHGRFRAALGHAMKAQEIYRERCTGVSWELNSALLFHVFSLYHMGEMAEMSKLTRGAVREAEERGDLYLWTNLCAGLTNSAWLVVGDVDAARRHVAMGMERWSRRGFYLQHYYEQLAYAQIALYSGDPRGAYRSLVEIWPAARRSFLFNIQLVRSEAENLRGRLALATAVSGAGDREEFLAAAARMAKVNMSEKAPWANGLGRLLGAGVAAARTQPERCQALLRGAITDLDKAEMSMHAAMARKRLGDLVGGDEGRSLSKAYDDWATAQRIARPDRMLAVHSPGFPDRLLTGR